MFFTKEDKRLINECFMNAESRSGELFKRLYEAEHRINRLEAAYDVLLRAEHGLKKDGTPRAKPGRKAQ